ncbi:hypothetical protein CO044_01020 [Candidatus Peregrinibacteria bacterium CG_4_9_14_0_2_um_filter_38_9]|nr:MAG: hypothetical protein CO044_01020 [Candidatus Peregrinibacteria bacterium CG_4_9_14_0_2_um_filter_38_9]
MRKALGFTLIEILLVIALLGILSVAALSSYMQATRTFAFVSAYKGVISILREPRAYAVAGQTVNGVPVQRFGVKILPEEGNDFTVFADNGTIPFKLDNGDTVYTKKDIDALSGDPSKPYVLKKDGTVPAMSDENILFPIYLFYETGTGNLAVYAKKNSALTLISAVDMRYLAFNFLQDKTDFLKYITVFQTSGIAEGFDVKPNL